MVNITALSANLHQKLHALKVGDTHTEIIQDGTEDTRIQYTITRDATGYKVKGGTSINHCETRMRNYEHIVTLICQQALIHQRHLTEK